MGSWFTLDKEKELVNRDNGEMIYEYNYNGDMLWEVFATGGDVKPYDANTEGGLAFADGGSLDDYNFKFTVGKWGGFFIGDGEYFMEDFKSLVESKPQFFVKTEQFKDYFETTYIANPFDDEDL